MVPDATLSNHMMLEFFLTSPRLLRAWATSPVSSLVIIYVILMIYIIKSKIKGFSGGLVIINLLVIWGIVRNLLIDDDFFRYIGFTNQEGLIFYISSFLVVTVGSIYFGLLKEFKEPNTRFRVVYGVTSVASLCGAITLLLLVEVGPNPDPYFPFWQPTEVLA
ncbi:MAG: hypothetical protein HEP71_02510 [Roseivirga sp.]|nr:hypothetical protein [Roseivirga sp.]